MSLVSAKDHGQGGGGAPAKIHTRKLPPAPQHSPDFSARRPAGEEQQGQGLSGAVHPESDVPAEGSQEAVHQPEGPHYAPLGDAGAAARYPGHATGAACGEERRHPVRR